MKFIGVYDYTVILTYMSLVSGLIGAKLAFDGQIMWAILCVGISGFLDLFDGAVARTKKNRTEDQKNFGIQLDSLCDIVCFGVVPAIILYFCGVDEIWGIAFLIFYVLCALIRLAFFNVLEAKRQKSEGGCTKYYRGLPVTTASMIMPACFLVGLVLPDNVMNVIHHVLPVVVGLMFITDVRVPKWDVSKLFRKIAAKKSKQREQ